MTDIVERIRKLRFVHIPGTSDLMEEACQEIERLRNQSYERSDEKRTDADTIRLTDAERGAIEDAAGICEEHAEEYDGAVSSPIAATLRSLLERLK
jgi:hypothetical protein